MKSQPVEVYQAAPGTLLTCVKNYIVPGTVRIYKYQQVIKQQNFDSGKIAIKMQHNTKLAVTDPDYFSIAKQPPAPEPKNKTREWKPNI